MTLFVQNAQRLMPNALLRSAFCIQRLSFYGGFAEGVHLFPYRTEKLSPSWPMVLYHNTGE